MSYATRVATAFCAFLCSGCTLLIQAAIPVSATCVQLHDGPPRLGTEVAILRWGFPLYMCDINGTKHPFGTETKPGNSSTYYAEIPPGDYRLSLVYFRSLGLSGYSRSEAPQPLHLRAQAGHSYSLLAATDPYETRWSPVLLQRRPGENITRETLGPGGHHSSAIVGIYAPREALTQTQDYSVVATWRHSVRYRPGSVAYLALKQGLSLAFDKVVELSELPESGAPADVAYIFSPRILKATPAVPAGLWLPGRPTINVTTESVLDIYASDGSLIAMYPLVSETRYAVNQAYHSLGSYPRKHIPLSVKIAWALELSSEDAAAEMVRRAYRHATEGTSKSSLQGGHGRIAPPSTGAGMDDHGS
jgi:hypothetical protein